MKKIEAIRMKKPEMKNTIYIMKSTLEIKNRRLDEAEGQISDL